MDFPILTILTFLPLTGALLLAFSIYTQKSEEGKSISDKNARLLALWVSLFTFAVSVFAFLKFDNSRKGFQFVEKFEWVEGSNIFYHLGVDGISIYLILLTTFLIPVCIISSWRSITKQVKEYMILFLVLETLVIGVFVSLDFLLFYFFFEASLIPMFIIIGVWGAENRVYAAYKFFLYTLLGSLFLLLAIIYLYVQFDTTDILVLAKKAPELSLNIQRILWLAFFASFAVKVPMWPFHTWLPDAHVQAPTAGSVILAGVLLKLGAYGFIRLSLPILPDASHYFAQFILILSAVAVIYTSLVALMQEDMKKMIAYSSVAHMGYVTAGIFAFNHQAIEGAVYQMLSHGIVSAALFLCVGVLYDRLHTKKINKFGGIVNVMPRFALVFMIFTMASVGLPGTSGFVGEFLVLLGLFKSSILFSALVATGVVLGAAYMLWLYRRVVYGDITNPEIDNMQDMEFHEKIVLYVIAAMAVIYGIMPWLVTDVTSPAIKVLLNALK